MREYYTVIAVKNSSGEILWSWHIWLTDQPVEQIYNNNAGTMMDRNLGATSATPGDVKALGLLYQWGRKDPFLSGNGISSTTLAASTLSWPSPVSPNSSNSTIDYAVAHPTTFIGSSSDWGWGHTVSQTLWQSTDNPKSIYDPCPMGWRVPDADVWAKAFASAKDYDNGPWNSTSKGMNFGSSNGISYYTYSTKLGSDSIIWYPASGCLDTSGGLENVGVKGEYWSSSYMDSDKAYSFYFYFGGYLQCGYVYPTNTCECGSASPVRCMKDN